MIEQRLIDSFVIAPYSFRFRPTEEQKAARAASLAATESHPVLVAVSEPDADGKHQLLDGELNWEAQKINGVQMVSVRFIDVALEDRAYMMLQLCQRRNISHYELANALPILDEKYDRLLNGEGESRRSKFIADQFIELGFAHLVGSQNNVDKFRDICNSPDRENHLRRLDSRRRQLQSTWRLAKNLRGDVNDETDDERDGDDDDTIADSNTSASHGATCAPVAAGRLTPVKVIVNDQEWECNAGDLCGHCKVHEFIMRATTNLPPVTQEGEAA
jgi:hypothetical protein